MKKVRIQMMKKNDNRLKILSVLVAIFMWTFVTNSTNPNVNKIIRSIPIVIKNQDDLEKSGYTIIGGNDNLLTNVKLKGSREKLVDLKAENIYAYVDISDLREGVQSLKVKIDTPTGISVENSDPDSINLNIQKVLEKKLPVNLLINEEIKEGRIVEVNELKPKEITVKGPAGVINKVDRAEAKIDDIGLIDGKVHNIPINVVDREGKNIANINMSDVDANVSFRVFETKKVPIKINTTGLINSSYQLIQKSLAPDSVVIKGPESIIKDIDELYSKPINISNLRTSINGEIDLELPDSVEVYDGKNVVNYKIDIQRKPIAKPNSEDKEENE